MQEQKHATYLRNIAYNSPTSTKMNERKHDNLYVSHIFHGTYVLMILTHLYLVILNTCNPDVNNYILIFWAQLLKVLGPFVQSIVKLTCPLRGQLIKCFTTLYPNTLKFFVEKMREAFAMLKLLTFFQ